MRITAIDLQCEDIMWFGIDNNNHIFECTSAGCGNVPEFVCISKENTDKLLDYFMNELQEFTEEKLLVEYIDTNSLLKDCIHLSKKGIFCYDIYEDDEQRYVLYLLANHYTLMVLMALQFLYIFAHLYFYHLKKVVMY